jgi:hypothetical protein
MIDVTLNNSSVNTTFWLNYPALLVAFAFSLIFTKNRTYENQFPRFSDISSCIQQ